MKLNVIEAPTGRAHCKVDNCKRLIPKGEMCVEVTTGFGAMTRKEKICIKCMSTMYDQLREK